MKSLIAEITLMVALIIIGAWIAQGIFDIILYIMEVIQ